MTFVSYVAMLLFNMYTCFICQYGYTSPFNLARHMRLHIDKDAPVVEIAPGAPRARGAPGAPRACGS